MKRLISVAVVLLSLSAGAYSASRSVFTPVFYMSSEGECLEALAIPCAATGFPDCVQLVLPIDGSPLFFTQIYASRKGPIWCSVPYSHF